MKKKTARKVKKTASKALVKKGEFNLFLLAAILFFLTIVLVFSFRW